MLTSLNRRIYGALLKLLAEGRAVDVSYFGEMLNAAELGFLVSLLNSEKGEKNALIVLKDSIKVILGEKFRQQSLNTKEMSDEDWANSMQKIIENKQKGN